jgi:hypothetical protein
MGVAKLLEHVTVGYPDAMGRLLRLDATYIGAPKSVLCVYAPSEHEERIPFLQHALPEALPDWGPPCIVGGGIVFFTMLMLLRGLRGEWCHSAATFPTACQLV